MPPSVTHQIISCLTIAEDDEDVIPQKKRPLEVFLGIAHWLPRSISPFLDLELILDIGVEDSEVEHDASSIECYDAIMDLHPDFPALVSAFKTSRNQYERFLSQMSKAMREARAQDTNNIKRLIGSLLPLDPIENPLTPAISPTIKATRGWVHIGTASALVPMKDKGLFDQNIFDYMKKVEQGKIQLRSCDLPTFLFEDGTVYDENEPDKGLFRSHTVIRALRLFYTGESSITNGHRAVAKPGQAEIHGMQAVTPQAVAYTACQIYVSLSTLQQWNRFDGYFDIEGFYDICIKLFTADPNDPWSIDTLKFLTNQLPALKRKRKAKGVLLEDPEADPIDKDDPTGILAIRAKRARENEQRSSNTQDHGLQQSSGHHNSTAQLSESPTHQQTPRSNTNDNPPALSQTPCVSPPPREGTPSPGSTILRPGPRTRGVNLPPSDDDEEPDQHVPVKAAKTTRTAQHPKAKRKRLH